MKLYEELGWESLSDRRMCKRVLQIHKIVNGRTPSYLRDIMPPNRRNLANLPCAFREIKCRTDRYLSSFFPDAISVWNNIISNYEYLPTFGTLKNHLISLIPPKSRSTFDIHDSLYLRHLFQLRVGLSILNTINTVIILLTQRLIFVSARKVLKTQVIFFYFVLHILPIAKFLLLVFMKS